MKFENIKVFKGKSSKKPGYYKYFAENTTGNRDDGTVLNIGPCIDLKSIVKQLEKELRCPGYTQRYHDFKISFSVEEQIELRFGQVKGSLFIEKLSSTDIEEFWKSHRETFSYS